MSCSARPGLARSVDGRGVDVSSDFPKDAAFAPDGDLLVIDGAAKQVKRIPADKL